MCQLCDDPDHTGSLEELAKGWSRRGFLAAGASLGTVLTFASTPNTSLAQTAAQGTGTDPKSFIIRGAYVITMDPELGDLADADVHVVGDKIVAIGKDIGAEADLVIEGAGKVVMPGFIDTHTHMWNAIWRNINVSYQQLTDKMGPHYRPEDFYNSVSLCALEMLSSGVTTVHGWEHNIRKPEHADAELQALKDTGIRARFSYGFHHHIANDEVADLQDMTRARDQWSDDLVTVGYASRVFDNDGVGPSGWPAANEEVRQKEWGFARAEGLPITYHVTWLTAQAEPYVEMAGPDLLLVHGYQWGEDVWRRLAEAGAKMSMSPYTSVGYRAPIPFEAMKTAGIDISFSLDNLRATGIADTFREMHMAKSLTRFSGANINDRDLMEIATLGGAKAMDIDDVTGSLKPGKLADLIVVEVNKWNMQPMGDIDRMLVHVARPEHVLHVAVGGRLVKRDGVLQGVNTAAVAHAANETLSYLLGKTVL